MFDVRPAHWLRTLIIVRYHDGDGGVVLPYAVNEVFQFVVAQEGLGGDGDESANIVLCVNTKERRNLMRHREDFHQNSFFRKTNKRTQTCLVSRVIKFWDHAMCNSNGEKGLVSHSCKADCKMKNSFSWHNVL